MMFAGVASASPPNWTMTVTKLPGTVSPGATAGYQVVITNNGPSNISQLYLVRTTSLRTARLPDDDAGLVPHGTRCPARSAR